MEWTSDVAAGDWIRERVDPEGWSIHHFIPQGMPAYARIFHPVYRERVVGASWPTDDEPAAWERLAGAEVDTERVTWQQTADAFGTTMHELAQWRALIGAEPRDRSPASPVDGDGWRYDGPGGGGVISDALEVVAPHLVAHTTTPDEGYAAVWEGWGGIVGAMSTAPSSGNLARQFGDARHDAMLKSSVTDVFNNVFRRRKTWRPGVLSDEISRGPRLELPHRDHVLFRAAPRVWADPSWEQNVPWRDSGSTYPPSLIWPADRSWVVTGDVDDDTSLVAGSAELIRAICADPRIEAREIPPGTTLHADVDPLNWV
ncbi:hypothetical protein [Microbacterium karelineae]|uniref:hypothetical protein n=1 Tax=Microbacterium karelineae TaxID=2654283 RepID=UPI0012E9F99A|nr:hypothetical protein [Microbacterium karelineae]